MPVYICRVTIVRAFPSNFKNKSFRIPFISPVCALLQIHRMSFHVHAQLYRHIHFLRGIDYPYSWYNYLFILLLKLIQYVIVISL